MKSACVSIGLLNPKSPENVDGVLRAAGNYRVNQVYYTGQRYPRALALNPDTPKMRRKVSEDVTLHCVDNLLNVLQPGMQLVCVEFALNAQPLPDFEHPQNACYVFGPEDGSLSQSLIDRADAVVYVPTVGSMNLAASVNVLLYDRLCKLSCAAYAKNDNSLDDNALIRQSRDTNNNLRFKR
ncbi:MAG TPA: TrmH family RNA methyltransferase [Gammaproteobacteria bacterium]